VRFTGSNAAASRRAMSKSTAKARFEQAGVPTPKHVVITGPTAESQSKMGATAGLSSSVFRELSSFTAGQASSGTRNEWHMPFQRAIKKLGYPMVIKPDAQGSSLGVGLVRSSSELSTILADSSRFGWPLLAEQYIEGREFTVTVLGRRVLQPLEITGCGDIFDYDSKYSGNKAEYHIPGDFKPITLRQLRTTALRAAIALETAGMIRVDLILDRDGQAWVLEVNTLPGMTPGSLAPKAARQIGWEMPDLCDWMLRDAIG
ncbi:MAG: ATP-grasp domain-containing protein, partial [Pirellulales bacterium]|nr:ATP-grasp domain-containing protein [Pirellulales bacterium]